MSQHDEIKILRAAQDAAVKLTTIEQTLRDRHATLQTHRRHVFHALRSRAEILANEERLVDEAHARWWSDRGAACLAALSGRDELRVDGLGTERERERVRHVAPQLPTIESLVAAPGALTLTDLCGLLPDVVKGHLRAAIEAMPDERFGLSGQARTAKLAELDAEIADVERRHAELVDSAAEVGIALALLPAVQERRTEQARRTERERELATARAATA